VFGFQARVASAAKAEEVKHAKSENSKLAETVFQTIFNLLFRRLFLILWTAVKELKRKNGDTN
jgi:hypothetical protein